MGLDSIWDNEGNYLTKKSKGFKARSTGCDCCSIRLEKEMDVKLEAMHSLQNVILAAKYFKWDIDKLVKLAKKNIDAQWKDKEKQNNRICTKCNRLTKYNARRKK